MAIIYLGTKHLNAQDYLGDIYYSNHHSSPQATGPPCPDCFGCSSRGYTLRFSTFLTQIWNFYHECHSKSQEKDSLWNMYLWYFLCWHMCACFYKWVGWKCIHAGIDTYTWNQNDMYMAHTHSQCLWAPPSWQITTFCSLALDFNDIWLQGAFFSLYS